MASHTRAPERTYHQDYIARIRYENNLPPPPGAPKLLNIPIEGLSYYTSAAFASRLARQQPLNIEADAELGMPIDLVGLPGVFDNDESAIQAPLAIPPTHPRDKPLLRPLSDLGKPKFTTNAHSFLRRTEYISTDAKARAEASANAAKGIPKSPTAKVQRRQTDLAKEDPINILRHVIKGFDLAHPDDVYQGQDDSRHLQGAQPTPAETEAWKRPRHPTKPGVKLVESYPLKPDLEAMPDSGTYLTTKFAGNPTTVSSQHDVRMDVGLLNPMEKSSEDYDYEFYLVEEAETVKSIKRKFDYVDDYDEGSEMTDGTLPYSYHHHRTYELARQMAAPNHPYKEVGLALHDPAHDKRSRGRRVATGSSLDKAAYYYPIGMRLNLKAKRNKNLANLGLHQKALEDFGERPDEINLIVRDPDADESSQRKAHGDELLPKNAVTNGVKAS